MKKFLMIWHEKANALDALILSLFTALITIQPYFMHGKINLFEVGLYLPGINAILHGAVPFRDFFHLRGPFELYMPAFLMKIFGNHIDIMYFYFYVGTILGLILCVWIGREIYKTRYVLYLMVPVLVARTFPRVVYNFWGGMRYALGLLALFCAIKFFKKDRPLWMFLAGLASCSGAFISIEIGVCAVAGILAALIFSFFFRLQAKQVILKGLSSYILGLAIVGIPFLLYLYLNNALLPYIESVYTVVFRLHVVIDPHLVSTYPRNAVEAFAAMVNPVSKNFRHMTPSYLYIVVLLFLAYRIKNKKVDKTDMAIVCLAVYGIIMYNSSFRGIWAAQFEMALQPEKILFFLFLERFYLFLKDKKNILVQTKVATHVLSWRQRIGLGGIYVLLALFFLSCIGYSVDRYNKRFYAFDFLKSEVFKTHKARLVPGASVESRPLVIERARGVIVPAEQAEELDEVVPLIQRLTGPNDIVFTYPEIGTYNFLADRPFLGRFPLATFSWFNDRWHEELKKDLITVRPKIIVLAKDQRDDWKVIYLSRLENKQKYDEMIVLINSNYESLTETRDSYIYKLKENNKINVPAKR